MGEECPCLSTFPRRAVVSIKHLFYIPPAHTDHHGKAWDIGFSTRTLRSLALVLVPRPTWPTPRCEGAAKYQSRTAA